jgi:serine/threonine-protein kinase
VIPTLVFLFTRKMSFVPGAPASQVRTFLMFASLWCLVAVATAALQSRLLYGLRWRIREAMRLGQYTLAEKIGEGGMGAVYRATHAMLRRPAAIKLLLPGKAGEHEIARFEREVQLTSQLRHPNTISIFDYGRTSDGTFYYVMELLDGFDLDDLVKTTGPLPSWRVLHLLQQASSALVEAHGLGLIHRDIKPANLFLTRRIDEPDVLKVVDFGLVKSLGAADDAPFATKESAITGTPLYLAPEAINDPRSVDARADLYALGAVGYFLLSGKQVFEGKTVLEVCSKHLLETPLPPSRRVSQPILPELEALILSCLAKSPEDRPASAAAFRAALLRCAEQAPFDAALAARWWEEQGAALVVRRSPAAPSTVQVTATIDLLSRVLRA